MSLGLSGDERETNAVGGPKKKSFLDSLITGLFGPAKDEMTPEDAAKAERAQEADQKRASSMAVQASQGHPGEAFMGPPVVSDATDIIKQIMGLFGGGGGGGA